MLSEATESSDKYFVRNDTTVVSHSASNFCRSSANLSRFSKRVSFASSTMRWNWAFQQEAVESWKVVTPNMLLTRKDPRESENARSLPMPSSACTLIFCSSTSASIRWMELSAVSGWVVRRPLARPVSLAVATSAIVARGFSFSLFPLLLQSVKGWELERARFKKKKNAEPHMSRIRSKDIQPIPLKPPTDNNRKRIAS